MLAVWAPLVGPAALPAVPLHSANPTVARARDGVGLSVRAMEADPSGCRTCLEAVHTNHALLFAYLLAWRGVERSPIGDGDLEVQEWAGEALQALRRTAPNGEHLAEAWVQSQSELNPPAQL